MYTKTFAAYEEVSKDYVFFPSKKNNTTMISTRMAACIMICTIETAFGISSSSQLLGHPEEVPKIYQNTHENKTKCFLTNGSKCS